MNEFLNSFIAAFITNRTLLWSYCDNRPPCRINPYDTFHNDMMIRYPWIMSWKELQTVWTSLPTGGEMREAPPLPAISDLCTRLKHRYYAEENMMCCGIDRLASYTNTSNRPIGMQIVNFGTFEQHELLSLSLPHANLHSTIARYRAQLLLLSPLTNNTENVRLLHEHFAYGILFRHAFHFAKRIERDNDMLLYSLSLSLPHHSNRGDSSTTSISSKNPYWTASIHIRHASQEFPPRYSEEQDILAWQCLNHSLSHSQSLSHSNGHGHAHTHGHNRKDCVILLASDRNESLAFWRERERDFTTFSSGTSIHSSRGDTHAHSTHHSSSMTSNSSTHINNTILEHSSVLSLLHRHCRSFTVVYSRHPGGTDSLGTTTAEEHGPFAGETAMRDIDLLSRFASDVFIGSTYLIPKLRTLPSSFSLMIASLRATNGFTIGERRRETALFLPECEGLVYGRRVSGVKGMYVHPDSVECKDVMRGVLMPDQCPHKKGG